MLRAAILSSALAMILAMPVCAAPWVDPGDARLRHHIQVLADAGIITVPVTTWPLMWSGIGDHLARYPQRNTQALDDSTQFSLSYVQFEYQRASGSTLNASQFLKASGGPQAFTHFGDTRRESAEAGVNIDYVGDYLAVRLAGSVVDEAIDDKTVRYDGSFAALLLGNWVVSAGAVDQWWGPGWQNSLILSSNARPVPAISLQRNRSVPFDSKWLSWIGPWHLNTFIGQKEHDRYVPDTKLVGFRLSARPLASLELGLSRTAQWGGEGRPQTASTFWDLLIGKDNRGSGGIDRDTGNEPGNQLAGIDFRYNHSFGGLQSAVYGQLIGEDEAGYLPSRLTALFGLEASASVFGVPSRFVLEGMDTATDGFKGSPRYNYAYEHFIYKSGYRYQQRAIGASTDNDSRMISLAGQHYFYDSTAVSWSIARLELNRDGRDTPKPGGNSVSATGQDLDIFRLGVSHYFGPLKLGAEIKHMTDDLEFQYEEIGGTSFSLNAVLRY